MGVGRAAFRGLLCVGLSVLAERGTAASELGPAWFHVDGGVGYAAGSISLEEGVGAGSLTLGASFPLARGLRATIEQGFQRTAASGPGVRFPEGEVTQDGSTIVTALVGFELYGPVRGGSGPFVHEAFGFACIAPGALHYRTLSPGGTWSEESLSGRFEVRPAISLAAGFRRLPKQGGLAMRLVFRYLMLPHDRGDGMHTVSLALGLGF